MDTMSPKERSERMSRIRHKNTMPEMVVRRLVHQMGYRYRLHGKDLPGKPDLVFRSLKKAIFVHGCFWHRHKGCALCRWPKSNLDFWKPKLQANRKRDLVNQRRLEKSGWSCLVIWECGLKDRQRLAKLVAEFLEDTG
ncbi:MAG TPA: very short patch repair endonuclease [Gemmataceae bacterium]|jgi:DNA mismatch endonuclease (patch repair protein)|nr:very short patch repair endonuclease [Gemmataceae bacterium]